MDLRNGKAVEDASNIPTAQSTITSTEILDDGDETSGLSDLQERAGRAGLTLIRGATGFVLIRPGVASWHSSDLRTIRRLLLARGIA